jgi:hypothetical protein
LEAAADDDYRQHVAQQREMRYRADDPCRQDQQQRRTQEIPGDSQRPNGRKRSGREPHAILVGRGALRKNNYSPLIAGARHLKDKKIPDYCAPPSPMGTDFFSGRFLGAT